jgi:hypothetical protein
VQQHIFSAPFLKRLPVTLCFAGTGGESCLSIFGSNKTVDAGIHLFNQIIAGYPWFSFSIIYQHFDEFS